MPTGPLKDSLSNTVKAIKAKKTVKLGSSKIGAPLQTYVEKTLSTLKIAVPPPCWTRTGKQMDVTSLGDPGMAPIPVSSSSNRWSPPCC